MADGAALKASLVLRLDDLISPGIKKLQDRIAALQGLLKRLAFDPLAKMAAGLPAVTRGVTALGRAVGGIGTAAQKAGAQVAALWRRVESGAERAMKGIKGAGERLGAIGGAIGGAVAGVTLLGPIEHWGEFSNTLRHIAITAGKSGPDVEAEIARLQAMFYKDALESGQSSRSIADAYSELIQLKIPAAILDRVIGAHSRAATAYNISAAELGPAVGALLQNLHVPEGEIGGALAAMAVASREGRFKVSDFSREFPGVAAQLGGWGAQGRDAANVGFAALQTVMMNASIPSQAATDFSVALRDLGLRMGRQTWRKEMGFELLPFLTKAREAGQNPVDAVLAAIHKRTAGMNIEETRGFLGGLFHGQQQADAWLALLQHEKDYHELLDRLRHVGPDTLDRNFIDAVRDPSVQVRMFKELLDQIGDTLGRGFLPVLQTINRGLLWFNEELQKFQKNNPELTAGVLAVAGALLALVGALGAIGMFSMALAAVSWPILAIVAAIGALGYAAYEIYENWSGIVAWFAGLWEGVKKLFWDFIAWVKNEWAGSYAQEAVQAIKDAFWGLVAFFEDLWARVSAPFKDLLDKVERLKLGPAGGGAAPSGPTPYVDEYGRPFPGQDRQKLDVTINVNGPHEGVSYNATPGTTVRLPGGAPDRGPVLSRP